ncbi:MAG TPA: DUF916 domain-containing protein [Candidatus Saccharimonadales bacterium]|nr:DUF916 domain-containing protein [Candidatus Saccharimonadales bacterium]
MFRRRFLTAALVMVLAATPLIALPIGTAHAATQTATVGGNALKVSPVRDDLTMNPGTSQTIDLFITNLTNVATTLHVASNDFTAGGTEDGQPNIILDETQYAPSHSLKRLIAPLVGDFTLAPQAQKDVKVTITVPKDTAGGGYYGAIRFYPPQINGQKNLNLAASVGTLVLLRVSGQVVEKMDVASMDVRRGDNAAFFFTSNKNLSTVVRFHNTGNVQLEPFGKIELKRFGKQVASFDINNTDPRGNVLPDSIRRFTVPLNHISSFGKFTLVGNFGYGTTGQLLTASTTFYVVPVPLVLLGLLLLVALIFLIFVLPRMIRAYNRRIIRRATRRR